MGDTFSQVASFTFCLSLRGCQWCWLWWNCRFTPSLWHVSQRGGWLYQGALSGRCSRRRCLMLWAVAQQTTSSQTRRTAQTFSLRRLCGLLSATAHRQCQTSGLWDPSRLGRVPPPPPATTARLRHKLSPCFVRQWERLPWLAPHA